jgi:hypothetical protein
MPAKVLSTGALLLALLPALPLACSDGADLLPIEPTVTGGTGPGTGGGAGGSAGGAGGGTSDAAGIDAPAVDAGGDLRTGDGAGADGDAVADGGAGPPPAFTLVVLPDTQYYSLAWPHIFSAQTAWIARNAQRLRVPYVFHLGDIVDQNSAGEWQRAAAAMSLLDGVVPYALGTGNHDFGDLGNSTSRDTLLNQYFPFARTAAWDTFGGAFDNGKLENTYHLFSAGGRDYIVIVLEWAPRDPAIAWANQIMAAHPGRSGILITHAYMNNNDRRYDFTQNNNPQNPQDYNPHLYPIPGPVNDGEELWQKLVRKHRFVMTFNGHVLGDGTGYLASVTDQNTTCHQMLSNYQFRNLGGEGYLRLLEFQHDGRTVKVTSYSPLLDTYLREPDQSFTFALD